MSTLDVTSLSKRIAVEATRRGNAKLERSDPGSAISVTLPNLEASASRERLHEWSESRGPYTVRFARTADDRRAVQTLRYEVFARELGAKVAGADRGNPGFVTTI